MLENFKPSPTPQGDKEAAGEGGGHIISLKHTHTHTHKKKGWANTQISRAAGTHGVKLTALSPTDTCTHPIQR